MSLHWQLVEFKDSWHVNGLHGKAVNNKKSFESCNENRRIEQTKCLEIGKLNFSPVKAWKRKLRAKKVDRSDFSTSVFPSVQWFVIKSWPFFFIGEGLVKKCQFYNQFFDFKIGMWWEKLQKSFKSYEEIP